MPTNYFLSEHSLPAFVFGGSCMNPSCPLQDKGVAVAGDQERALRDFVRDFGFLKEYFSEGKPPLNAPECTIFTISLIQASVRTYTNLFDAWRILGLSK